MRIEICHCDAHAYLEEGIKVFLTGSGSLRPFGSTNAVLGVKLS
jgi:hypothetical protein